MISTEVWHTLEALAICLAVLAAYDAFICKVGMAAGEIAPPSPKRGEMFVCFVEVWEFALALFTSRRKNRACVAPVLVRSVTARPLRGHPNQHISVDHIDLIICRLEVQLKGCVGGCGKV